jgi:hypothetical protein
MKKLLGICLVLAFAMVPAYAQKITIDYAHDFDFSKVKTFKYVDTEDTNAQDPLMDSRLKSAIIKELTEGGLQEVDSDADLFVTYHLSSKENTVLNTTSMGYGGMGRGWGGWGGGMAMGTSTTTASTYTMGTLLLDAFEPSEKKMVWRGSGTVTLKQTPEKIAKQIDKVLVKMGQRWDKILKNQGK